jgi:membrane-bound ClpP family serine protease
MNKKGEISTLKAWMMVLLSLVDDIAVLAAIFLILWHFGVRITLPVILIATAAIIVYGLVMNKAVVPALRRKKVTGIEGMIGATGKVTETLNPVGMVQIKDEYWQAVTTEGEIETGATVEVTGVKRLRLEVKKKTP